MGEQQKSKNLSELIEKAIKENGKSLERLIEEQLKKIMQEKGKKLPKNVIIKELRKIPEIAEAFDNITKRPKRIITGELIPGLNIPEIAEAPTNAANKPQGIIMDGPIPEINIPILKPSKPISQPVRKVYKPINKEINKFADWILSYIPEPIKKTVNKRVDDLKKKVDRLFKIKNEESTTDLINKNISELTNNKPTKPKKQVNMSESVRDELNERGNQLTPKQNQTALRGYLKTYRIDGQKGYGPKIFINKIKQKVLDLINKQKKPIKIKFIFTCRFKKSNPDNDLIDEKSGYFHSKNMEIITEATDFSELYDTMTNHLLELVEDFQNQGSGWQFDRVEYFDIYIDPYEPISGSSYIPLPLILELKKAIINVKNENDHECFKWAITSAAFPKQKNPQRLDKQMRENSENFNWKGIEFPVKLKDIAKFEKQNPYYTINVHGFNKDKQEVYPLRISKKQSGYLIELLLIKNEEGNNHYCWIKNFSRLVSSQINNNQHKREFCRRCYNPFPTGKSLEKHLEYCSKNEEVKINMPKDEDGNPMFIKFNNYNRKMRVPFVFYVDFESFTEKIHTCSPNESESFTNQYQKHKPSGFSYIIKSFDDELFPPELVKYTAESEDDDIPQIFVDNLEQDIKKIYNNTKYHKKAEAMSEMDKKEYENATHCHICEEKLGEDKVLDHCHLTGKYRGAAHNECNLNYKIPKFFPVIFHNLSGYDAHLFIKNLGVTEGKINCIPNNEEKYISFTKQIVVDEFTNKEGKQIEVKRDIRFIDSFKFMQTSLSSLVDNLTKCGNCEACKPWDCMKRYIEDKKIVQYKGIGNCENVRIVY